MADSHGRARRRVAGRTRIGGRRERARVKHRRRRSRGDDGPEVAQARHAHVPLHRQGASAPHIPRRARVQRGRRRKEVYRGTTSVPHVGREMVIGKRVLCESAPCCPSRHPLEPVLVLVLLRALCHLDIVLLRRCIRVIFEKVGVDVAQVDEFDVGCVRAKVESCDFDGSDKGRPLGVGELFVEDVDEGF